MMRMDRGGLVCVVLVYSVFTPYIAIRPYVSFYTNYTHDKSSVKIPSNPIEDVNTTGIFTPCTVNIFTWRGELQSTKVSCLIHYFTVLKVITEVYTQCFLVAMHDKCVVINPVPRPNVTGQWKSRKVYRSNKNETVFSQYV